jgi:hypothetical protein
VRGRSYTIQAELLLPEPGDGGVLLSHGDRHGGYALRVQERRLLHHYSQAGTLSEHSSTALLPVGVWTTVGLRVARYGAGGEVTLTIDGSAAGGGRLPLLARARTGYTGVDVGCDRGLTVGDYPSPSRFTGRLRRVVVEAAHDQWLDPVTAMVLEGATG